MTATVRSARQLRVHEERVARMLADPELVGELLAVGLVFARAVDLGTPPLDAVVEDAGVMLYGQAQFVPELHRWRNEETPRAAGGGWRRVKDVLHTDIRRYQPDLSRGYVCQRPVRGRPEGHERCLRAATWGTGRQLFVDPLDGTRAAIGACNQDRCRAWWQARWEANQCELAAHPAPEPVANRGGLLDRHIPEIDWPQIYSHLDPKWTPPHEAPGWRPPQLRLLVNLDPELPGHGRGTRPTLTVHKGGWG